MSCGHAVTPVSLLNWCGAEWSYAVVYKMALLTPEEKKNCKVCTAKRGRAYDFCWQCVREWKGLQPRSDRCENDGCSDGCSDLSLQTLRTCPDIVFESVTEVTGCPSMRACPTCGSLLEHSSIECKNTCSQCKVEFCFMCLKVITKCSKTSSISGRCSSGVAPRQTFIPVWWKK